MSEFIEKGYKIIPNLISDSSVDKLLEKYNEFKNAKKIYFSQATHRYVRCKLNKHGFLKESMEGVGRQYNSGCFGKNINRILLGKEVEAELNKIFPNFPGFVQHQHMFFDLSMETVDHIDSWYLDTYPKGYLVGLWVALENINKNSGPFRIYPGSHKLINPYDIQNLSHKDFLFKINTIKENLSPIDLTIPKGHAVIWDSALIHGASTIKNDSFSRKSLTAHYSPLNMQIQRKNIYKNRLNFFKNLSYNFFQYPTLENKNLPIYKLNNPLSESIQNIRLFINQIVLNSLNISSFKKPFMDMRSKSLSD